MAEWISIIIYFHDVNLEEDHKSQYLYLVENIRDTFFNQKSHMCNLAYVLAYTS